jgi:multiple sugar transport system substrate-binding protein
LAACTTKTASDQTDATKKPGSTTAPSATAAATKTAPVEITFWGDWRDEGEKKFVMMAMLLISNKIKLK